MQVRRLATAVLAIAALTLAFAATQATAAVPDFEEPFDCSAGCGTFTSMEPGRIAVDETSGKVYVVDIENDVVNVFSEAGEYQSQLVVDGGSFDFNGDNDIAVDNTEGDNEGNVYIASGGEKSFAFDSDGDFLWESAVSGSLACGVSVDSDGSPWVMSWEDGAQKRNLLNGTPEGSKKFDDLTTCWFDFDGKGNAYLVTFGAAADKFNAAGEKTGFLIPPPSAYDVAVDRVTGRVYVDGNDNGSRGVWAYSEAETDVEEESGEKFAGTEITDSTGVAVNGATGKVYVSNAGSSNVLIYGFTPSYDLTVAKAGAGSGTVTSSPAGIDCGLTCVASFEEVSQVTLTATPSPTSTFTGWSGACSASPCTVTMNEAKSVTATFAQKQPGVFTTAGATAITQKAATVAGSVNPNGTATSCEFEYGITTAYGSKAPCASSPGSGIGAVTVSAALAGLAPSTTYHFRLVATNAGGTAKGADQTFATLADTCQTNPALCPPPNPPVSDPLPNNPPTRLDPPEEPRPPVKKSLKCKKGFKKKTVKGKQKCVKVKKHKKKRH
jgi:DNA-binding beta-propeller fold protein YncE